MKIELCGHSCEIPEDMSREEQDKIIKDFVQEVTDSIPEHVWEDICDEVWLKVYGELPAHRKAALKARAEDERRRARFCSASLVVLSEDDIREMQEVMKQDEEYEARRLKEKLEKDKK